MKKSVSLGTRCINAGAPTPQPGRPFKPGPQFASTFHLPGDIESGEYQYGRFGQPTWEHLEQGLAELEGGHVLVFPSGMAAATAILTPLLESGDTVLLPGDGYAPVVFYVEKYLTKFGVKVKKAKTRDLDKLDVSDIKLALLESPSNPMLDVFDISAFAERLHSVGGLLAIDNTTLTPLGQNPLELGADISMGADTKALNGHSDVLFGHIACKDLALYEELKDWRKLSGNIPGPMETWLVHRSLSTLDVRLQRMCDNAQQLAEYLLAHDTVRHVRYPGLTSDPSYQQARQQQQLFGFIVSFELVDAQTADIFLNALDLVYQATSFGGVHSMAERRARWGTDDIPAGTIRFSCGCERPEDLLQDVAQSLSQCV